MTPKTNTFVVVIASCIVAVFGGQKHAGGWNDGSRLATVECLVDYHTWAIDQSVFLTPKPYQPGTCPNGTLDRMLIDGNYYSDKSPVPALLMAGPYTIWRYFGGPSA